MKSSTSVPGSPQGSVRSPLPATAAELSSAVEPGDKDDDDDDNDGDDELVPQVMVGPDGNIVLNPGT